jgi:hypothetical protein
MRSNNNTNDNFDIQREMTSKNNIVWDPFNKQWYFFNQSIKQDPLNVLFDLAQ